MGLSQLNSVLFGTGSTFAIGSGNNPESDDQTSICQNLCSNGKYKACALQCNGCYGGTSIVGRYNPKLPKSFISCVQKAAMMMPSDGSPTAPATKSPTTAHDYSNQQLKKVAMTVAENWRMILGAEDQGF